MSSVYMIVFTVGLAVQILAAAGDCEEGALRFDPEINPQKQHEGNVQFCFNNKWSKLCGGMFNRVEATIICKQLGYLGSTDKKSDQKAMSGPFVTVSSQACDGYESALTECTNLNKMDTTSCTNYRWVKCLPADCTNGSLRLVNGTSYREGRVEVCVDGRWGTVCYNEELAGTVCQQLGFGSQGATPNPTNVSVPKINCTIGNSSQSCEHVTLQGMCEALFVQCNKRNENCSVNETTPENINIGHPLLVCTTMESSSTNLPCTPSTATLPTTSEPTTTLHANSVDNTNNDAYSTTQQTPSETTNSIDNTEQPTCTCPTTCNYNTTLAGGTNNTTLGVLIGLLALLEIATVIGCVLCIIRRKTTPPKPPRARGTSFINESYETNPPVQSEYSTVGPHYDKLQTREPPKIEPYQPAHPPPVGGVSDDEFYNAEDHTYAAVPKKQKGGAN